MKIDRILPLAIVILRIGNVVCGDGGDSNKPANSTPADTRYRYNTLDLNTASKRRDEQLYEVSGDLERAPITLDESQHHHRQEQHESRDRPVLRLCCEPGLYFRHGDCIQGSSRANLEFPPVYEQSHRHSMQSDNKYHLVASNKSAEWHFRLEINYLCEYESYGLYPEGPEYYLLDNGHVITRNLNPAETLSLDQSQYCLATLWRNKSNNDYYDSDEWTTTATTTVGFDASAEVTKVIVACFLEAKDPPRIYAVCDLISGVFLTLALFVYASLPHLQNLKGVIVSSYVTCLAGAYFSLVVTQIIGGKDFINSHLYICNVMAYIVHFSFLASFFWLNVMCFDIWWTFGGFRSLHGSVKQRERKKFIMYSIYAWGCASILTGICMIMDLVPGIPDNFIKPEFGKASCWFHTPAARALYFYGPMGLTIICNIILFILTALKISRHKKDTARQLKGSDSRRHDDNKQWFNLYLKLFIVMGINWSMEIISWLVEDKRFKYLWFITDLTNTLQGVIIFIIFVWKDKIKRLLMKRFGCESGFLSRNSRNGLTTNVTNSSAASKTTCVTSAGAPLHEKVNPFTDPFRGKSNANNSIATTTTSTANDCNSDANGASDVKDGVV